MGSSRRAHRLSESQLGATSRFSRAEKASAERLRRFKMHLLANTEALYSPKGKTDVNKILICALCVCFFGSTGSVLSQPPEQKAKADTSKGSRSPEQHRELAVQAWKQQIESVTSTDIEGTYTHTIAKRSKPQEKTDSVYKFRIACNKQKYYCNMSLVTGKPLFFEITQQMMVYDGDTLAVRTVSPREKPKGEETRLYTTATGNPVELRFPYLGGNLFSRHPAKLLSTIGDIPQFFQDNPSHTIQETGDQVTVNVAKEKLKLAVRFSVSHDYRPVDISLSWTANKNTITSSVQWKKHDKLWYPEIISIVEYNSETDEEKTQRYEFTNVILNQPIDPSLFTLNALNMKIGSRMIDYHTPYTGETPTFRRIGTGNPHPDLTQSIAEAIRKLPADPDPPVDKPATSQHRIRTWVIRFGIALSVLGALIYLYSLRRKRPTVPPSPAEGSARLTS